MSLVVSCTADNQVDERSRLEEHDRVMDFIASDSRDRGSRLMLHPGDLFERRSTVRERASVRRWIGACRPQDVVIAGGNHESEGEVAELHAPLRGVWALERPDVVFTQGCAVAVLPWPKKAWLAASLDRPVSKDELGQAAREGLTAILEGFRTVLLAHDGPRILIAHAHPFGSRTNPDQPARFGDVMELAPDVFARTGADIVFLGHIHMPQEWTVRDWRGFDVPVIVPGSPRRTAYAAGELVPKSYVVAKLGDRRPDGSLDIEWERVPTPATPMHLVETTWVVDANGRGYFVEPADHPIDSEVAGAEIRFRFDVDADHRAAAMANAEELRAEWLEQGALDVKLDPRVRPTTTARAPGITQAKSTKDALDVMWGARDDRPASERRERLFGKLAQLQEEVRA